MLIEKFIITYVLLMLHLEYRHIEGVDVSGTYYAFELPNLTWHQQLDVSMINIKI